MSKDSFGGQPYANLESLEPWLLRMELGLQAMQLRLFVQRIRLVFTFMEHPQTNGQVEAVNKTILNGLKMRIQKSKFRLTEYFLHVLCSYHMMPQSSTCETPFSMVYGGGCHYFVRDIQTNIMNDNIWWERSWGQSSFLTGLDSQKVGTCLHQRSKSKIESSQEIQYPNVSKRFLERTFSP